MCRPASVDGTLKFHISNSGMVTYTCFAGFIAVLCSFIWGLYHLQQLSVK